MPLKGAAKLKRWHEYYRENKDRESVRSMEKRRHIIASVKAFLAGYLSEHPCVDCGEADPVVLEFDHRMPEHKKFSMAEARRGKKRLAAVIDEVAKCDIRCANCHRRRTALQVMNGQLNPGFSVRKLSVHDGDEQGILL